MNKCHQVCPICNTDLIAQVLTISQVPVHCNLLFSSRESAIKTPRGDISLAYCRNCGHLFNSSFQPELMTYEGRYENSLHFSPMFQAYAHSLAADLVERYDLVRKNLIEIGVGRGDFLYMLCHLGNNQGIGFDPSYIPEENDWQNGKVTIYRDYYTDKYAKLPVDFILSRHVFEHIDKPAEFLSMLRGIIANRFETVIFFEVPNAAWTIESLGIWDLIYEHFSYFSDHSLEFAFRQAGFDVLCISEKFSHQFLTIEARTGTQNNTFSKPDVLASLRCHIEKFSTRYKEKVFEWLEKIKDMEGNGERAVVWGAGSKGVTFLNALPTDLVITNVVDINPRKHGMFVAGTGHQIISPDDLLKCQPDVVIIMNANYLDEIRKQLQDLSINPKLLVA